MKYKVKMVRTEIYERVVEIEAESKDAAIAIAKDNETNNEYAEMFDLPDEARTDFSAECVDGYTFPPFKRLKVEAEVEWDADEEDMPFTPKKDFKVVFTPEELEHFEVLDRSDPKKWSIPKEKFEEWFGEYLTDFTDFCHRGFTYDLTPLEN
jgi:hypothetical protein